MGLFDNNDVQKEKKERKAQQDKIARDEYVRQQAIIKANEAKKQKRKS
jgi:hypothetical protein